MNAVPALFDASTAPPLVSQGGAGQISGGLLRPGAIDQGQFQQMLEAQQSARAAAGVGGKPVMMPIQSFQDGIPTLTSAQFAALVGNQGDAPTGSPSAQPQATTSSAPATLKLSGAPLKRALDPSQAQPAAAPATGDDDSATADVPMIFRAADPKITTASAAATNQSAATDATAGAATAAAAAQSQAPSDPRVVHLKDAPDRETQQALMSQGKRWIVDETPGSRQLFFGEKGTFGWKDFLDVINPLQHIPIVSQIYQAITGDKMNGAAELIGAIPFGPIGVVGMMGAIADLAVRDVTGKDIGGNLEAMVFGDGTKGSGADATNAASTSSGVSPSSAETSDASSSSGQPGATQTALAQMSASLEQARQMHNSARA